ncbi:SMYD [Lepeophtheirus salmonis]|uniref:SMYD n=1 Tax=Lepeophtheirus salmonis TaxID=72036 RepID=A0A7R8CAH3_LEPSM|nr:SMYD [Lepeophtheirus salmonis]CAF2751270.1 SMYD [Lepeophtheirus salmonis]
MSINSVITIPILYTWKKEKKAKGEWEFLQKEVVNYIRNRLFMASDVGDEELHLLIGLFVIHSTPLEYDCIGNVHFSIDASNACISLKASHDIEKGQRMTVNFSPSVLGTLKRRKRLKSLYFFDCTCMRCRDPTEFGHICDEWSCSDCEFLLSNSDAERIIDSSEDELTEISMMKCCKRLKDYIEHYEGKILHTNHYLLLLAKRNYVLISRKEKISSLAKSKDPRESKLELPKKKELYEDFWWIIERLGIQDCF